MNDDYVEEIKIIDIAQEFAVLAKANIGKKFTRHNAVMEISISNKKVTVAINCQNIKWNYLEIILDQFEAGEWKEI